MQLLTSLTNAKRFSIPFPHHEIKGVLEDHELQSLNTHNFGIKPFFGNATGTRDRHSPSRWFQSSGDEETPTVLEEIRKALLSKAVIESLEKSCGVNLNGTLLRIEVAFDGPGFWLCPHTDLPEKLLTIIVCLRSGTEDNTDGTALYKSGKVVKRASFPDGGGLILTNKPGYIHGSPPMKFTKVRKSLQISYISSGWRDVHQLCGIVEK